MIPYYHEDDDTITIEIVHEPAESGKIPSGMGLSEIYHRDVLHDGIDWMMQLIFSSTIEISIDKKEKELKIAVSDIVGRFYPRVYKFSQLKELCVYVDGDKCSATIKTWRKRLIPLWPYTDLADTRLIIESISNTLLIPINEVKINRV